MVVADIDDVFLPYPEDLLITLNEARPHVEIFLEKLPEMFNSTTITNNALGSAMQAAYKLIVLQFL